MGGAAGCGGFGGTSSHAVGARVHHGYYGYADKSIADEIRERGLESQREIEPQETEMDQKPCNCIAHIAIAILSTALILTVAFAIFWENT